MPSRRATTAALLVLAAFALFAVRPWLAREHDIPTSVVGAPPLRAAIAQQLRPGVPVCETNAVIDQHSHQAHIRISQPDGRPSPPIRLSLSGSGYAFKTVFSPGYRDANDAFVAVPAPPKPLAVRLCLRNLGTRSIGLLAANDRAVSRSLVTEKGKVQARTIVFSFTEGTDNTILERAPLIAQRVTVFRPFYIVRPVVYLLALLFLFGVPAGVVWAVRAAGEAEEREP